ncbi:hypothetical protein BOC40_04165 [Burkholderia pseudomallei]|nr:hypothetical protein BOC40_04165 [Burkholderia pseudomallei]ARL35932.1 hypothetical protein BOC49_06390 [Burkholderia pseudomallei]ARL46717.1 hypothetical protein BOC50_27750 [Burkholderia pseudomallei]QDH28294.1 hypothetical protein FKO42_12525 [Burkholderia pseudomallei]QDH38569.1 hypothetical protein FKO59_12505 [Burkholderia pseudomallei]
MAARASAALAARPSAGVRIGKQRSRAPSRFANASASTFRIRRSVRFAHATVDSRAAIDVVEVLRFRRAARVHRRARRARGDGAAPGLLANRRAPPTACANDYAARTAG